VTDRREFERRRMAHFRRTHRGQEPPKHGLTGYQNYGCRCSVCREANREATARNR